MSATQRPWRKSRRKSIRSVDEFGGFHVAQCRTEDDADLIVRVVETHDDLVAALEACLGAMYGVSSVSADAAKDRARAALTKARGEPA